jgi:hypothetical protein
MLSHGLIGLLQDVQREEGHTIERSRGILYMHTFRNDPIREPSMKTIPYSITYSETLPISATLVFKSSIVFSSLLISATASAMSESFRMFLS